MVFHWAKDGRYALWSMLYALIWGRGVESNFKKPDVHFMQSGFFILFRSNK